jgi:hypothetical protein
MTMPQEDQTSSITEQPLPDSSSAASGPLFVCACIVMPVLWGVIVHQIFKRVRKKERPDRIVDAAGPDYQI